jgi:hypothetical protein
MMHMIPRATATFLPTTFFSLISIPSFNGYTILAASYASVESLS